uniref:ORF80a n=1 Tax=Pinus koraiensis TaxID=88728 RepID=Q85X52_PINKO|nr:ORF80a [Pinus koraiensis]
MGSCKQKTKNIYSSSIISYGFKSRRDSGQYSLSQKIFIFIEEKGEVGAGGISLVEGKSHSGVLQKTLLCKWRFGIFRVSM